jgi:hypothetical protein
MSAANTEEDAAERMTDTSVVIETTWEENRPSNEFVLVSLFTLFESIWSRF